MCAFANPVRCDRCDGGVMRVLDGPLDHVDSDGEHDEWQCDKCGMVYAREELPL